jgi:hypothetical protein
MNDKRQRAMRDGFEKMYGVTMGCQVEETFCSACGGMVTDCDHIREAKEGMRREYLDAPHFEVSFVSAPKCEACETPMEPTDSLHWACVNDACDREGITVHTGVYPFLPIEGR